MLRRLWLKLRIWYFRWRGDAAEKRLKRDLRRIFRKMEGKRYV